MRKFSLILCLILLLFTFCSCDDEPEKIELGYQRVPIHFPIYKDSFSQSIDYVEEYGYLIDFRCDNTGNIIPYRLKEHPNDQYVITSARYVITRDMLSDKFIYNNAEYTDSEMISLGFIFSEDGLEAYKEFGLRFGLREYMFDHDMPIDYFNLDNPERFRYLDIAICLIE